MKKLIILTLMIGSAGFSVFASGTGSCDSATSSGCGVWWQNYTLGTSTDGVFAQSSGVGLAYTANFTSVAASQDPLTATFPWVSNTSLTTSNVDSSFGSLLTSVSSLMTTTSNTSTSTSGLTTTGGFGDIMFLSSASNTPAATTNVASLVPTNTSGSLNISVVADSNGSYSNYLAQVYGLAYGNQTTSMNVNPNAVGFADPIIPEPSSYISMGFGLAAVLAYARRRKRAAVK